MKTLLKTSLKATGLLTPAQKAKKSFQEYKYKKYLKDMVKNYSNPLAKGKENDYLVGQPKKINHLDNGNETFQNDIKLLKAKFEELSQSTGISASSKKALEFLGVDLVSPQVTNGNIVGLVAEKFLDVIIDFKNTPCFYDYDYIDHLEEIILIKYSNFHNPSSEIGNKMLQALWIALEENGDFNAEQLKIKIKKHINDLSKYTPVRGKIHPHVGTVIPDLVDEFVQLKGESNSERFLEINKEYSLRQRNELGAVDTSRDLSLLRGYESDHFLMLRMIISFIRDGLIQPNDPILIIGPRHVDEIDYFRDVLGLKNTIGLDLYDADNGKIITGDMHKIPFKDNHFKLVYSCNTLTYAYNIRKVAKEIARVTTKPGYVLLIDSCDRVRGPDPLGRSDVKTSEALARLFYPYKKEALAIESGTSLAPQNYRVQPCVAIKLL